MRARLARRSPSRLRGVGPPDARVMLSRFAPHRGLLWSCSRQHARRCGRREAEHVGQPAGGGRVDALHDRRPGRVDRRPARADAGRQHAPEARGALRPPDGHQAGARARRRAAPGVPGGPARGRRADDRGRADPAHGARQRGAGEPDRRLAGALPSRAAVRPGRAHPRGLRPGAVDGGGAAPRRLRHPRPRGPPAPAWRGSRASTSTSCRSCTSSAPPAAASPTARRRS